jgi:hypothetical protein
LDYSQTGRKAFKGGGKTMNIPIKLFRGHPKEGDKNTHHTTVSNLLSEEDWQHLHKLEKIYDELSKGLLEACAEGALFCVKYRNYYPIFYNDENCYKININKAAKQAFEGAIRENMLSISLQIEEIRKKSKIITIE